VNKLSQRYLNLDKGKKTNYAYKKKKLGKWKSCVECILENKKIQEQSYYGVCTLKDKELDK
jgi:hypothetical protein